MNISPVKGKERCSGLRFGTLCLALGVGLVAATTFKR